jgi:hypothetical protein
VGWYLDTNEEAGCAVHISHRGQCEHVPEGLAALLVVENPHSRLAAVLDGLLDLGDGFGVSLRALSLPPLQSF